MSTSDMRTGVTAPPSGGAAATGLGEAFSINLNTGQGVYSYRLQLPGGRAGHGAALALEYAHGNGVGPFGLGWRVAPRAIARRLDLGLPGTVPDERYLDGSQELVETPAGHFSPVREGSFTRYRRSGDGWRIEERDGLVHECGLTEAGRVADPAHPERVQEWLIERSLDASGNEIAWTYERDGGHAYPATIGWAAYLLRFVYEERPDVRQDARAGFPRTLARRCRSIELLVDPGTDAERLIRSWTLSYLQDPACGLSLLESITLTSHGAAADGSQDVVRAPIGFGYAPFDPQGARVGFMEAPASSPPTLDTTDTALVTLDRAPLPGVLQVINGEQWYWPNDGNGRWGQARPVAETPDIDSFGTSGVLFADANGSGTADMMVSGSQALHGYYENGGDEGWARFVAYPRGHAAAPPWSSGTVRLMDTDGDGLVDAIASGTQGFTVWRNGGTDGWSAPLSRPIEFADGPAGVDFADPLVHIADMNGDGIPDIVRIASDGVEYWEGLGDGRFGPRVVMAASPRLPGLTADPDSVVLADVDGNGCASLVRVTGTTVQLALNRDGREFTRLTRIGPVPGILPGTLRAVNMKGRTGAGLLWCGIRFGRPAYVRLEFTPGTPPYLLTSVDNGAGLRSEITYRAAVEDHLRDADQGAPWTTNLPFPVNVVASTRERDTVSGQETVVEYEYHEGHFAPSTRQFQGFRRTDRVERGDASRPDTLTVSHFLLDQERVPGHGPEHVELNGMLARTEVFALDGTPEEASPYRVEESDHALRTLPAAPNARRPRTLVTVTAHRVEDRERTGDVRGEERVYAYDAGGNVIRETLRGYGVRDGVPQPERSLVTDVEYAVSATRHLLGRPSRTVERDATGAIVRERRRYYDGSDFTSTDFTGLPLGQADRGLLVREEALVLPEAEFAQHYAGMKPEELGYHTGPDADGTPSVLTDTERCAYDARGLKIARRDALGNETTTTFDADGLFALATRDSLGETHYVHDRAIGQPVRIEYPDGGVSSFSYDAQGRALQVLRPGEDAAAPPRTYGYDDRSVPNARRATFRSSPGDACAAVTYFDGHGREIQQRVEAGDGRVLVSAMAVRNPWGDVRREYEPTVATSLGFAPTGTFGRAHRAMRYDVRGRVVRTTDFGGAVSRAEYRPFEVVLWDSGSDVPRREEFDVLRDRTRVTQELGGGATAGTAFTVSPGGDLAEIRDDSGTLGTYAYDRLGRRLVADHREGGRRRVLYDARGAGVGSIDADGNELRAEIDSQGRLVRLRLGEEVVEEFGYDDPARRAFGRLSSVTYPGGRQDFSYDAAGRVERHEYGFDGARTESLTFAYDGLGREISVTHTDGRTIARELTPNGWVRAIPGILDEIGYDARGLPTRLAYANGVVTDVTYGPGPGSVDAQRTTGPSGQVLHDVRYQRSGDGLLARTEDATPGGAGVREFFYDPLRQIREVREDGAATLGYAYDRHFNLTTYADTGATLRYDDPVSPYRLTGVTSASGQDETLGYDANGNVTSRGAQLFAYDYKQALARFEDGNGLVATYGYDPFGARVSKVVDDGQGGLTTTFFVGEQAEIRDGAATLFVRVGELRVAILDPDAIRFAHPDPLGSTAFFTDESGAKTGAVGYLPFGNVATGSGEIDMRCFGSHPFDAESGLYFMRRRYYDPATARFLQADPIAVLRPERYLTNPRAFHPYAYVGNDPLNNADPTGLSFWSVVGAIAGIIAAGVVIAATLGFGLIVGAVVAAGMVTVSYMVASSAGGSPLGEFARGFMIGMNGGLNAFLGGGLSATIGLFFALEGEEFNLSFMRPVLGWSSWFAPMSWLATGVGLAFFVFNVHAAAYSRIVPGGRGADWQKAQISRVHIDWPTGSIVTQGGLTEPINADGYNLGNFIYIHRNPTDTYNNVLRHEAGHTLNVAAYGGIFHFIGAINENIGWPPAGTGALAELYAESNVPASGGGPAAPGLPSGFPNTADTWYMVWV